MKNEFSVENVVYINHDEKDVRIYMADKTFYPENITYYHILRLLDDKFVRINKSVIVNLEYALRIDGDCIFLVNDCKFNILPEYEKSVTNEFYKLKLNNFMPKA